MLKPRLAKFGQARIGVYRCHLGHDCGHQIRMTVSPIVTLEVVSEIGFIPLDEAARRNVQNCFQCS